MEIGPQSTELITVHVNFKPLRKVVLDTSAKGKKQRERKLTILRHLGLTAAVE